MNSGSIVREVSKFVGGGTDAGKINEALEVGLEIVRGAVGKT